MALFHDFHLHGTLRFLTFVAFPGIFYSIYRIITLTELAAVAEKEAVVSGSNADLTKEKSASRTDQTALGDIPYAKRPRVYLFTGRGWYQACRTLDTKMLASLEWKALSLDQIVYKEVVFPSDISKASKNNRDLVSKFGIQSVPTLLVVTPTGSEMGRHPGAGTDPSRDVNWVRDVAGIRFRSQVTAGL